MRTLTICTLFALALAFAGCKKSDDTAAGTTGTTGSMAGTTTTGGAATPTASTADESKVIGKYTPEFTPPAGKENDPGFKMAQSMMKDASLELKADHTYSMTMMSMPIEGTWSMSGDKVSMVTTKALGMTKDDMQKMNAANKDASKAAENEEKLKNFDKPQEYTIGGDGDTLTPTAGQDATKGTMVFKKQK